MTTTTLFKISLIVKGVDALLEVFGGTLLLLPVTVDKTIAYLSQHELYAEPHHHLTAHLEHAAMLALQRATLLGAIYLIVHGLAKIVLIVAVFQGKKWGYRGLAAVLSIFAILELGRGITAHSGMALFLALFDGLVVYLIHRDYKQHFPHPETNT